MELLSLVSGQDAPEHGTAFTRAVPAPRKQDLYLQDTFRK